jgi:prepilin-type processing-associated H-X9-DG protein
MARFLGAFFDRRPTVQSGTRAAVTQTFGCPGLPTSESAANPWIFRPGLAGAGRVSALFADGSVRTVDADCDWTVLFNALATKKSGEPLAIQDSRAAARAPRVRRLKLGTARVSVPGGGRRVARTRVAARTRRMLDRQRVRRLRLASQTPAAQARIRVG